ncbi:MAG: 16S rRNA (guanine(527)-N(7))-methyltransferase RsmG [Clostridiales bacterium]|nr:16S rRNA (guanine(527)-N(7))-methyltransferase RsmG [Clostridiales bacterium]
MFKETLTAGLPGISPETVRSCEAYWQLVKKKNEVMNLTAVTDDGEAAKRHFLDSLELMELADFSGARVIDVGTGAGFPGVPLKLAVPDMSLCLLDSLGKRVDFLREACGSLGVEGEFIHARAEEQAMLPEYRDSFDFAVSRAVARLNMLAELCLPFVKPGGAFLAMKAGDSGEEINEAKTAIRTLGGRLERVYEYELDGVTRCVAVIRKAAPTPKGYPRAFAKIKKSPL